LFKYFGFSARAAEGVGPYGGSDISLLYIQRIRF